MANSAIQSAQFGVATESQRGVVNGTDARNLVFGGSALSFRNKIINGAMMVDQRNAGANVTPVDGQYTLDRWFFAMTQTSKFTSQQNQGSITPPAGFANYLGVTSSSSYAVLAGDIFRLSQAIEGYNVADLGWGTANAKSVTLSFWVRSSLTGTFGGSAINSAANRSYPFTYSISAANTWEYKTVVIPGDTTGTWLTTNGIGIRVNFGLGVGSTYSGTAGSWAAGNYASATGATSLVGTNGATLYITGVQLEAGSVATPFENRPIGTELALAQRYAVRFGGEGTYSYIGIARASNTTTGFTTINLPVQMRQKPNFTAVSGNWELNGIAVTSFVIDSNATTSKTLVVSANVASGLTAGQVAFLLASNSPSASFMVEAEL